MKFFSVALFVAAAAAAPGVVTQISDGQIQAPTGYTSIPLSTAPPVVTVTPTPTPAPYPISNSTTVAPGTGSSTASTPSTPTTTPIQVSTAGAAIIGELGSLAYFGLAAAAYFL